MRTKPNQHEDEGYLRSLTSHSSGLGYCGARLSEVAWYAFRHSSTVPVNNGRCFKTSFSDVSHSSGYVHISVCGGREFNGSEMH